MEKLKKLLKLDILGWLLILISVAGVCDSFWCVKLGVILIVVNKLNCVLGLGLPFCDNSCSKE